MSDDNLRLLRLEELKVDLLQRWYPEPIINDGIIKAQNLPLEDLCNPEENLMGTLKKSICIHAQQEQCRTISNCRQQSTYINTR